VRRKRGKASGMERGDGPFPPRGVWVSGLSGGQGKIKNETGVGGGPKGGGGRKLKVMGCVRTMRGRETTKRRK